MEPVDVGVIVDEYESVTYAADQAEYRPLPALRKRAVGDLPYDGEVISRWRLSDEERKKIAAGDDLFVSVLTFGQNLQPMSLHAWSDRVKPKDAPLPPSSENDRAEA